MTAFDPRVGVGVLACADGEALEFHATAITDGTRDIEVGTAVLAQVGAGHAGRLEARTVTPLPPI